jgi:hypothetical protein
MGGILMLLWVLAFIAGLVGLVFFVLVVVEMFKRQQNGLAIACIVLALCTGIGYLIAFVYGWMKATEWNIKKIMLAWTACFAVQLVFVVGILAVGATAAVDANRNANLQMKQMKQIESDLEKQMKQMERDLEKFKP